MSKNHIFTIKIIHIVFVVQIDAQINKKELTNG